jgi:hypothetical protein
VSVSIRRAISATARAQNWKIWHDVQSVSIDLDTRADSAIYRVYRPRRGSHCVIDGAGLFRHPHVQDRLYAAVQVADSRPVWSLGLAGRAVSVAQSDNDLRVS